MLVGLAKNTLFVTEQMYRSIFMLLGFETQATWLHARAHHQYWNAYGLKKITAHSRHKREPPPSDHSGPALKGGAQPSFQPSHCTQRRQKSKDSNTPTQTQKERNLKNDSLSDLFSKLQPVAHTPSFLLFFLTTSLSFSVPYTVRERLFLF